MIWREMVRQEEWERDGQLNIRWDENRLSAPFFFSRMQKITILQNFFFICACGLNVA